MQKWGKVQLDVIFTKGDIICINMSKDIYIVEGKGIELISSKLDLSWGKLYFSTFL